MTYKIWNRLVVFLIAFLMLGIMLFNYIIDPYFVFNSPRYEGINKIKVTSIDSHMTKFYTAKRANPNVLLIGTSRIEHINPIHVEKYLSGKVYNLGLLGSGIDVQKRNIEYFIKNKNINTIILSLDFFSFNPSNVSSNKLRFSNDFSDDYLDSLLSVSTLKRSIKTFKFNFKGVTQSVDYDSGWRSYRSNYKQIQKLGTQYTKNLLEKNIKKFSSQEVHFNNPKFLKPHAIDANLKVLADIISICKSNNVALHMFISPIYSEITDLIYKRGYGETYDYWKESLASYENIYDFSGYNSITKDISNYIDGSHYKDILSPLILAKVFKDKSVKIPHDFGVLLNKKTLKCVVDNQNKRESINE
ncbi:hypothetical protein JHD48_01610 [Sulfurimonas sp. SAG-AH-194-I05]|nr:hypothetical protein [Sulfurimonas sp. SAG-AH-194-I05]MDF1874424.1 hypothetical protein [Sulfurimonas sp. SAG-AH-194-I05]